MIRLAIILIFLTRPFSAFAIGKLIENAFEITMLSVPFITASIFDNWFGSKDDNPDPKLYENYDTAIVLLHGKSANKAEFLLLKRYLSKKLDLPVVSFNLIRDKDDKTKEYLFGGNNDYTTDSLSRNLKDILNTWSQKSGIKKFILIGHSLGGIVAAHFEQNYASLIGLDVIMVLTIASPVYGMSELIEKVVENPFGFFYSDCVEDFRPNSDFIKQIVEKGSNNPKYYHIVATLDGIAPTDYAYLDQEIERLGFHLNGHYFIILNPFVFGDILSMIRLRLSELDLQEV